MRMRLLLLMFLISAVPVSAQFNEIFDSSLKLFETDILVSVSGCEIHITTEDEDASARFNITSPVCNSSLGTFSDTRILNIDFIRNVTFGGNTLENLTKQCLQRFGQTDYISNYTQCAESKAATLASLGTMNQSYIDVLLILSNRTVAFDSCKAELTNAQQNSFQKNTEITSCLQEKTSLQITSEQYKSQRWMVGMFGALASLGAYIWFKRRPGQPRESFYQQKKAHSEELKHSLGDEISRKIEEER